MKNAIIPVFVFMVLAFSGLAMADENVTITTYYPSPNGVYRNLRLYPSAETTCDASKDGTMYFNNTTVPSVGRICHYNGTGYEWADFGAGGSGYWTENSTTHSINNTNPGKVFIDGVEDANGEILEVHGDMRVYDKPPAGDGDTLIAVTRGTVGNTSGIVFDTWTGSAEGYHIRMDGITPRLDIGNSTSDFLTVSNAGSVGIGTVSPAAKLEVYNGTVYINQTPGSLIMKSADGTCHTCQSPNAGGSLTCSGPVACP
jgi:hypothetical protein